MENFGTIIDNFDAVTKQYVDDKDALKLNKAGGSITGDLTVGGNLTINGTTTTVNSTMLQVKDKLIEVAHGNRTTLTTPAGLVAPKYDGTNSGALVFDSTGTAYVGDVALKAGNIDVANSGLQPLATRTGLVGGNLVQYDSSALTLKDSGKKISDLATTSQVNAKYTKPSGGIPKTDLASDVQTSLGKADTALQSYTETDPTVPSWAKASSKPTYTASEVGALSLDGGTINKSKTIKMDASANSDGANLKWGTVNSKNPYIGYASDQVDGTFVVGSLLGTNYASGLAIGGGSGNLLWKGAKVATINDIPPKVTESTVSDWGFTKNTGTVTSVVVKMNGATKGTVTSSGTIDLGTVITSHQDISGKANLSGGNTLTGTQTLNDPSSGGYSINAGGYVKGSWLQASATSNKGANTGKVCVFDDAGWLYYRTPKEVIIDAECAVKYEVKKTIGFGQDGALYVGKFKVYDTNVTCEVTSTTSVTYSGKLVIATQNNVIKEATVYGDAANTVAPNFFIKPSTASDPYIEVYFKPTSWSKNVVHIYGSAITAEPTNVCTNVSSVPSTATLKPTNALNSKANLSDLPTYSLSGTTLTITL